MGIKEKGTVAHSPVAQARTVCELSQAQFAALMGVGLLNLGILKDVANRLHLLQEWAKNQVSVR